MKRRFVTKSSYVTRFFDCFLLEFAWKKSLLKDNVLFSCPSISVHMAALMSAGKPRRLGKSWNMSSVKKVFLKRPHLKGTAVFQPCPTTLESLTICRWEQTTYFKIPRPDSPSLGVHSALPTFSLCSATEFSLAWQAQIGQGHGGGGREIAPSLLPLSTHATQVNETLHWCTICTVAPFINLLLRPNSCHF